MSKNILNKKLYIELFILLSLLKEYLFQKRDIINDKSYLVITARKYGYDLTNPNDNFFLDICESFNYNKKDVSLEYKRKYFFFPENKDITYNFIHPKRNSTHLCFNELFDISILYKNIAFLILFPTFLLQALYLSLTFVIERDQCFSNVPSKKIELQQKYKYFCFREKNKNKKKVENFSEFVPEVNSLEKNESVTDTLSNLKAFELEIKSSNLDEHIKEKTTEKENSENSGKNIIDKTIKISLIDANDQIDHNMISSSITAGFDCGEQKNEEIIKDKNIDDLIEEAKKNNESNSNIEKKFDNYSFGNNNANFFQKKKSNEIQEQIQKSDDNKRREYIYKALNESKDNNKNKKGNQLNNSNLKLKITSTESIQYIREEYFYFGYLLARINDKRSIFNIYCDLLEQCQIIFKMFFIPFNIYEDKRLQILYYISKLQFHFLFNCLLINNNVINNIFDNKNCFINDLYRSLKAAFYTYVVGLFLYDFTNIKKTLIKRRYKINNMRITEPRINFEVFKVTYSLCLEQFNHKLLFFSFAIFFNYLFILYICFSFCAVYSYTQFYALKGFILSIIISQISPFALCWVPSYLRKKSLNRKNENLFRLTKLVEFFFIA